MPRVLVVEDDPGIRDYLSLGLGYEGFEVTVAPSGGEALDLLAAGLPDALILDLGLPGVGGLEVLRALRPLKRRRALTMKSRSNCSFWLWKSIATVPGAAGSGRASRASERGLSMSGSAAAVM